MNINFFNEFILRTPIHPFSKIEKFYGTENWKDAEDYIIKFFKEDYNRNALIAASLPLFDSYVLLAKGELPPTKKSKVLLSLSKYIIRMSTRATPFGLFSAISVGKFHRNTDIRVNTDPQLYSRPDFSIVDAIFDEVKKNEILFPFFSYSINGTVIVRDFDITYIECQNNENEKLYKLNSINKLSFIEIFNNLDGKQFCYSEAISIIHRIGHEYPNEYINKLINNNLLIPQLGYSGFIENPLDELLKILQLVPNNTIINFKSYTITVLELIESIKLLLSSFGINKGINFDADYRNAVLTFVDSDKIKHFFQIDSFRQTQACNLSESIQSELKEVTQFMIEAGFAEPFTSELSELSKLFFERYEYQMIPLLEAFNTENGIYYNWKSTDDLANMTLHEYDENENYSFSSRENYFFDQYINWLQNDKKEIIIDSEGLKKMSKKSKPIQQQMPQTLSIVVSIINEHINPNYLFKTTVSNTATKILSRFGFLDKNINSVVEKISNAEAEEQNEYIVAEINHLIDDKNNVVLRPLNRSYEISCFTDWNPGISIPLNDLYLSIKNDVLSLYSRKMNKYIIPYFSSALNSELATFPVFKFLCKLAEKYSIGFYWDSFILKKFKHTPRVKFKNFILSPASWRFVRNDYSPIIHANTYELKVQCIKSWRQKYSIPDKIIITRFDNYLYIDFTSFISINIFIAELSTREEITIEETFLYHNAPVKDIYGDSYLNEFVFSFKTNETLIADQGVASIDSNLFLKRKFVLGDGNWIYLKLYGNVAFLEKILLNEIYKLSLILKSDDIISEWFFIRYNDPSPHLRVRFLLKNKNHYYEVINKINQYLAFLVKSNKIEFIQYDTYNREIERYGAKNIKNSESIFYYDTIATLKFISLISEENERWYTGLSRIDIYLTYFGLALDAKYKFVEARLAQYKNEFLFDVEFNRKISSLYRKHKSNIKRRMEKQDENLSLESEQKLKQSIENIIYTYDTNNLIASYIHMSLNRLFISNQRNREIVLYNVILKYYESCLKHKLNS